LCSDSNYSGAPDKRRIHHEYRWKNSKGVSVLMESMFTVSKPGQPSVDDQSYRLIVDRIDVTSPVDRGVFSVDSLTAKLPRGFELNDMTSNKKYKNAGKRRVTDKELDDLMRGLRDSGFLKH